MGLNGSMELSRRPVFNNIYIVGVHLFQFLIILFITHVSVCFCNYLEFGQLTG